MALLAGMTFVACSSDDDKGGNCVTCKMDGDSEKLCKGDMSSEEFNQAIDIMEQVGYDCK